MKRNKLKNKNGITLIALVVTIIVLLILAGVSLSLLLSDSGIIGRAAKSKEASRYAELKEQEDLLKIEYKINQSLSNGETSITKEKREKILEDLYKQNKITQDEYNTLLDEDPVIIDGKELYFLSSKEGYARVGVKVVGENKYYEDSDGDKAVIPAGFAIVPGCSDVSSGLVISDVENDTSDSGNEFVWIPCTIDGSNDTIPYERHNFGKNNLNYGFHSETLSEDESNSIKNNGGFYIGRYETGTTVQRTEVTTELGTIFIKKNLFPYTCITSLQDCKDLSASMAANNGYNGITKLCSSYAWDTALRYIEKVTGTSYATSSTQGNYSDQNKSKYIDESGEEKTRILLTGQTDSICNIYDLGGNVYDAISESGFGCPIGRGGCYEESSADTSAGYRGAFYSIKDPDIGFRITLFL